MPTIRIPEFGGQPFEDVNLFIKIVNVAFNSFASQYTNDQDKMDAKTCLLITHCVGEAKVWVECLPETTQSNWDLLVLSLKNRFPKAKHDTSQNALKRLMNMKQMGRRLSEYFYEVRDIQRFLPADLEPQVTSQMVAGLDDDMVKRIVGSTYTDDKKTIDETVKRVIGASGDNDRHNEEQYTGSRYQGLSAKDKALMQIFEESRESNKIFSTQSSETAKAMQEIIRRMQSWKPSDLVRNISMVPHNPVFSNGFGLRARPMAGGQSNRNSRLANIVCHKCCQLGHTKQSCNNPEAP